MTTRPASGAARLAAILDSLPDALLLVDARGLVVNANTRALDLFETPDGPLVCRSISDVLLQFDINKLALAGLATFVALVAGPMAAPLDATSRRPS